MAARLGQHFLQDAGIARKMADYAGIIKKDTVLEIGPGKGILTEQLVKKARKVIAIEKDKVLAGIISTNFPKVRVIGADDEKRDFDGCLGRHWK